MNPFNLLRGQTRRHARNQGSDHNFVGATSFRDWNPGYSFLNHYSSDAYDSAYPSIRAITNEYMTIMPYAINAKKERQENNPIINALYHPNQQDSAVSFFEKMAVSTLFHKKTYILVWRREGGVAKPGGDFGPKGQNIAGFTFLEFPAIERREGRTYYRIGSQEFNDNEVLVLPGGVHPNNLYGGYSPSEASRKWGKLDDYIADYQAGFFENNAIPAGEFVITAPTGTEYNDIVDKLQARHKGAGKNNNVTYTHRPVNPEDGKPMSAQIEWIPFGQSNKDIDFKYLFEQVNKRIDTAYGVPAIVKGIDSAATYANAQVAEATFSKRAVRPLALRNYAQLTHELNRITGGIGVAITFQYDIPAIADEENVRAEMKIKLVTALNALVDKGYTVDQAIRALELPDSFKALLEPKAPADDNAEVDEGDEVTDAPDPEEIDGVKPLNKNPKAAKSKGAAKSTDPKAQLSQDDVELYEEQLSIVVRDHMSKQIEDYIATLDDDAQNAEGDPTEADTDDFNEAMLLVIIAIMQATGDLEYVSGLALLVAAGVKTDGVTPYTVGTQAIDDYRKYLRGVAESYGGDTASSIRSVLSRSQVEGWDRNRLETELRNIMNTDEWRVKRLATTEVNRSQAVGSIDSMEQIEDESGAVIEKSLQHTGGDPPCEFCAVWIDYWLPVKELMIQKNTTITGAEGGVMVYTWDDNKGHDVHANGHCRPQFRVKQ